MREAIKKIPKGNVTIKTKHDPFPNLPKNGLEIKVNLSIDNKAGKIKVDLTKEHHTQTDKMIKFTTFREEYDRLIEAGPIIDDGIIAQFNKKFKNYEILLLIIPAMINSLLDITMEGVQFPVLYYSFVAILFNLEDK
mgnify:CR=1 FL=1